MLANVEVAPWPFPGCIHAVHHRDKELMVISSSLPWAALQKQGHNSIPSTACAPLLCSLAEPKAIVKGDRNRESLGLEKISEIIKLNL